MNDNVNRSNLDNNSIIPAILIEDYGDFRALHGHSGERTPISSHFGSIASDELSVTSSQTSQQKKSHLSGRKLRLRLQALLRSKTDKQQLQQQFNTNTDINTNELTTDCYTSEHLVTDINDGTKSVNDDAIPPVPKFHETSPEHNSENVFKYSSRMDGHNETEEVVEYERKEDNHRETLLSLSYSNKYEMKNIYQTQPKHHADPLYEKHHVILEEKALMNTANTFSTGGHHGHHHHHHHHHHHKTRSNKNLPSTSLNVLQNDSSNSSTNKKTTEKNNSAMWGRGSGSANIGLNTTATASRKTHPHSVVDSKDKASGNRGDISSASNSGASGQSSVHSTVQRPSHSPFFVSGNAAPSCEPLVVISLEGPVSPNAYGQQSSEPKTVQTVHSRFRQFWVETFVGGRSRTKSENQTPLQAESHKVRFSDRLNGPLDPEMDVLPPHAYTITGGSSQAASILRPLAVYTNLSGPHSDQVSPGFISSGTGSLRRLVSKNHRGGVNGMSITPPAFSLSQQNDKFWWSKSPIGRKERFVSTGNITGKSSDDLYMHPKPSKLPREQPVSSLEFTTSRLKNPKKNFPLKTSLDVLRRKRAGSLSGRIVDRKSLTISPQLHRGFIMEHFSRSEENIVCETDKPRIKALSYNASEPSSATSASSVLVPAPSNEISQISEKKELKSHDHGHHHGHHHHHHHHHHHRHSNHGHHRNRGLTHTMTRVVESRRYLMFTKSLPFWSAKQYMETHGTGMGESETYAILFQHTPCYDLIPDSAKLILLDSQLTIGKAFKALIYNGIRAAPVWNSKNQNFISMLTVTDFVQMLSYCWNQTVPSNIAELKNIQIDDVDQITIQKWKDMLIADRTHRLSLQITSSTGKNVDKSMNKLHTSINLTSWPPSNNTSSSSSSSRSSSSNGDSDSNSGNSNDRGSDSSSSGSGSRRSSSRSSTKSLSSDLPVIQLSSTMSNQNLSENTIKCTLDDSENNDGDMEMRIQCDNTSINKNNQTLCFLNRPIQNIFPARLFICDPEESIFKALRLLLRYRLHHLPIMDSPFDGCGNILYVLTQRKLLMYMFEKLNKLPQPRFLQSSLIDLNIGTHGSILLVTPSTRLADALLLFQENCVTALPVVDSIINRRLVNIFSKFDVFTLVINGAYKNPNLTIQEVLDICKTNTKSIDETQKKPPVEICLASNNLLYVMEKLVKTGYRSLVIVNNTNDYRVDGIISLSDVLRFTVLQQLRITSSRLQPPSVAEIVDERDELNQSGKQKKKKKLKKEKSLDTTNLLSTCSSETIIKSNNNNNSSDNNTNNSISSHDTPIICTLHSTLSNTTVNTVITTNTTKTPITITTVTGGVGSSPEHINTSSSHNITNNIKINKSIKPVKLSNNQLDKSKINSLKLDSNNNSININLITDNKSNNNNLCSDQIIPSTIVSEKIT
ncbi:unnamed protein product [Schistosoma rodhaini]|nr:unnamed protein product [Schistosoma rodhaini]